MWSNTWMLNAKRKQVCSSFEIINVTNESNWKMRKSIFEAWHLKLKNQRWRKISLVCYVLWYSCWFGHCWGSSQRTVNISKYFRHVSSQIKRKSSCDVQVCTCYFPNESSFLQRWCLMQKIAWQRPNRCKECAEWWNVGRGANCHNNCHQIIIIIWWQQAIQGVLWNDSVPVCPLLSSGGLLGTIGQYGGDLILLSSASTASPSSSSSSSSLDGSLRSGTKKQRTKEGWVFFSESLLKMISWSLLNDFLRLVISS